VVLLFFFSLLTHTYILHTKQQNNRLFISSGLVIFIVTYFYTRSERMAYLKAILFVVMLGICSCLAGKPMAVVCGSKSPLHCVMVGVANGEGDRVAKDSEFYKDKIQVDVTYQPEKKRILFQYVGMWTYNNKRSGDRSTVAVTLRQLRRKINENGETVVPLFQKKEDYINNSGYVADLVIRNFKFRKNAPEGKKVRFNLAIRERSPYSCQKVLRNWTELESEEKLKLIDEQ